MDNHIDNNELNKSLVDYFESNQVLASLLISLDQNGHNDNSLTVDLEKLSSIEGAINNTKRAFHHVYNLYVLCDPSLIENREEMSQIINKLIKEVPDHLESIEKMIVEAKVLLGILQSKSLL